jgi:putative endonuclease
MSSFRSGWTKGETPGPGCVRAHGHYRQVETLPEGPVVYLLRCRDGSLYTGWTNDIARRLRAHAAGKASRYTRSRLPVELVLVISQPDATSARREEARIKRLPLAAKLGLLDEVPRFACPEAPL